MLSVNFFNKFLPRTLLCSISSKCCANFSTKNGPKDVPIDEQSFLDTDSAMFGQSSQKERPLKNTDAILQNYRIQSDLKKFSKGHRHGGRNTLARRDKPVIYEDVISSLKVVKKQSVEVVDTELGLSYTKLGFNDALMHSMLTTIRSRKTRNKNNQIIMEGRRLIVDALEAGLELQTLLFSQKEQLEMVLDKLLNLPSVKFYKALPHDLKTWSTLTTSPGLMAIFSRPAMLPAIAEAHDRKSITVICDNIREPNNLGAIIRSCSAIPCEQVIVLKGCCDPWESKALRAGCGGQFRVQIKDDIQWHDVAQHLPVNFSVFLAESNIEKLKSVSPTSGVEDFWNVQISPDHNVVVIGGETHGISEEAYSFLNDAPNKGQFLHIPLAKGIDSLNAATALTLILFEIKKRL